MNRSCWALLGLLVSGCAKDSDTVDQDSGVLTAFDAMIVVFEESCGAGCHTGVRVLEGLPSTQVASNLVDMPSSGDSSWIRVVCGDAEQSALYRKLFPFEPDELYGDPMPLGVSLPDADIAIIRKWIESEECGS